MFLGDRGFQVFKDKERTVILKSRVSKVALYLKDVCYPKFPSKEFLEQFDPHRLGTTPEVARKIVTKFFACKENWGYVLLVVVAGSKGKYSKKERAGHESTLILWREKSGMYKVRHFDPNIPDASSMMINTLKIVKKIKVEKSTVELLSYKNADSDCFAYNWKFVVRALDGKESPRTRPSSKVYNFIRQKYD